MSGATVEFLSIWTTMMAGQRPFFLKDGKLCLAFRPTLPGWLFDRDGRLTFTFLGQVHVTYYNHDRRDLFPKNDVSARPAILHLADQRQIKFPEGIIGEPYAQMIRAGQITSIDVFSQAGDEFDR
jgi:hypothetical protein